MENADHPVNLSERIPLVYFDLSQETITSSIVGGYRQFNLLDDANSASSSYEQTTSRPTETLTTAGKTKKMRKVKRSLLMMMPSLIDWFLEEGDENTTKCTRISPSAAEMYSAAHCVRRQVKKPVGFTEAILNKYSLDDFRLHFRMSRGTFEKLLATLAKRGENVFFRSHGGGRPPVQMETCVMLGLWYMVTTESLSKIGNRFGVTGSTTFRSVRVLTKALTGDLYKELVTWPTRDQQHKIQEGFKLLQGLPNAVGVLNSLHLPIRTPSDTPDRYRNRSGRTSIILQAVSNHKLKLIDCFVQCPGELDNFEVLKYSDLYDKIQVEEDKSIIPEGCYLLADETFPLLPWILTPYGEFVNLTNSHRIFNNILKDTKGVIDTTFRVILTRFHRLRYLDMELEFAYKFVQSVCAVYNHCVMCGEPCIVDNIPMKTDINGRSPHIRDDMNATMNRVQLMQKLTMHRASH